MAALVVTAMPRLDRCAVDGGVLGDGGAALTGAVLGLQDGQGHALPIQGFLICSAHAHDVQTAINAVLPALPASRFSATDGGVQMPCAFDGQLFVGDPANILDAGGMILWGRDVLDGGPESVAIVCPTHAPLVRTSFSLLQAALGLDAGAQ